ncbi:MAG: hypothetical protein CMG66_06520 [Candidatus Marinimicrobia bacterium]|nr:hypothetical protein [Candidatus Neomarinimicrobiota bacterium]|tara:strand:+ start:63764 stop:64222 length:459 start_codon:yes stop_codon:yes gene_type:complete
MFQLIVYIFKIVIAVIAGYALSYTSDKEDKAFVFHYPLISFLASSLVGVIILIPDYNSFLIGIIFFALIYYLAHNLEDFTLEEKYKFLFCSINGLIIGLGYIFYSIVVTLIFIYILNNFTAIYELVISNKKKSSKNSDIDSKNDLELNEEDS